MNSKRIATLDLVRIIGMVFVMFVHSPVNGDTKSSPEIFFLQSFIASGAVPVFFLLSGYLGARMIDLRSVSLAEYFKAKSRTLIIPFLFWNSTVILLVLAAKYMGVDSHFRGNGAYFDISLTFTSITSALIGIGRRPIVYQFWFLRDLIVVVFLAFAYCRYVPRIPLLSFLFFFIPLPLASSLGYYLIGYELHSIMPPSHFPSPKSSGLFCLSWILMGAGVVLGSITISYPFQQIGSAAFIFMLAVGFSSTSFAPRLSAIGPSVFFVYAIHEPLQTIIAKTWQSLQIPAYGTLFCFLLIPATVFPLCVIAYSILRRMTPQLMVFATGGR